MWYRWRRGPLLLTKSSFQHCSTSVLTGGRGKRTATTQLLRFGVHRSGYAGPKSKGLAKGHGAVHKSQYKLIAVDVDGTLLDSDHGLSAVNKEAIRSATGSGVYVVLATGRQFSAVQWLVEELELATPQIVGGGSMVAMAKSLMNVYEKRISAQLVASVIGRVRELGLTAVVSQGGVNYAERINEDIAYLAAYGNPIPRLDGGFSKVLSSPSLTTNVTVVAKERDRLLQRAAADLKARFGAELKMVQTVPYCMDIMNKSASKGEALRFVLDLLHVPAEKVVAIGDSENDLDMFSVAGYSVAMANADTEIKGRASIVTGNCDSDGVAEAIERLQL